MIISTVPHRIGRLRPATDAPFAVPTVVCTAAEAGVLLAEVVPEISTSEK